LAFCLLISSSIPANARYNEKPYGKLCDKYMGSMAANKSLTTQYNFAVNCLTKIKEEVGRDHDAYMLWISNIKNSEGKGSEALNWAWWSIGATQLNNHLDGRSPNDFMSIAYLSLLLHMTDGFRKEESLGTSLSIPNAETLSDLSLAVMKLSGCQNTHKFSFFRESELSPKGGIDFNTVDTTLSDQDKQSHCALASSFNLLSRMAMTNDANYLVACQEARSVVKGLSKKQNRGFRDSLGTIYSRMVQQVSMGKCKAI
tara:strand:+ start:140 stop:910 length:771 start_codon:yes stop_codon:yes gene_type:complete